jgi:DNA-binding MarR family transcriptional regulator
MLWRVSNEWQREIREVLAALGLTHVQFVLLANLIWLEDQGLKVTQAVLARQTAIDKMMVSDVVKTLEEKKMILKRPDPNDGRAHLLGSTKASERLVKVAMKAVEGTNRRFFARSSHSTDAIVEMLQSLSSPLKNAQRPNKEGA